MSGSHDTPSSPSMTRVIKLPDVVVRDPKANDRTLIVRRPDAFDRVWIPGERPPFRKVFETHYRGIAKSVSEIGRTGVVAVAVHPEAGVMGSVWVRSTNALRAAVVGRHSMCDLLLRQASFSLRQLLIVTSGRDEPVTRVLDLNTGRGFLDEAGRRLVSARSDGPMFLACGSYLIYLFPTPSVIGGDDAAAAWEALPARTFEATSLDEAQRKASHFEDRAATDAKIEMAKYDLDGRSTITSMPGIMPVHPRVGAGGGMARHMLIFTHDDVPQPVTITQEMARRGVLLGRYERCDGSRGIRAFRSRMVSRIHAVLLEDETDGQLYWIDTASTGGTYLGTGRVKVCSLSQRSLLALPHGATVCWEPMM